MKNYWKVVQSEFRERVFSSKKRVIKFVAICFVPFLYAFICIWAFWDPISNIGLAPMGIISNDNQVNLVSGKTNGATPIQGIGVAKAYVDKNGQTHQIGQEKFDFSNSAEKFESIITTNGTEIKPGEDFNSYYVSLIDLVMETWKTNSVPGISFNAKKQKYTFEASENISLSNVEYKNGAEARKIATQNSDGSWKVLDSKKYWVQVQLPQDFSLNVVNVFDHFSQKLNISNPEDSESLKDILADFAKSPINLWSTYRNNFIFGQFIYLFDHFKAGALIESGPQVAIATLQKMLELAPAMDDQAIQLIETIAKLGIGIINSANNILPDFSKGITSGIDGIDYNLYGLGLGQFFLCIGAWVGVLMQTFIYDRKKRVQSASTLSFYFGKLTLMLATALIQITILMLAVFGLGFHVIGAEFWLLFLWMIFTTFIFTIIINALWFSFRDQTVGKFLCVVFLVINLSSGWGTFPTFMQAKFFEVLSYIAPYTYSIHGQGAIIYGLAAGGQNLADNLIILANFGYLLIFGVIFALLGIYSARQRHREMMFSTSSNKKLVDILTEMNLTDFITNKNKANWKELELQDRQLICKNVAAKYPEEKFFKSYENWRDQQSLNNSEIKNPSQASPSDDE
ncbi:ABC transporter permease [Spiroplasma alleghenense]|uniref:Putative ABC transporter n=1 Tax=Spiroplasma alleghenense TaxID=216931 RepID=A0A345Z479_9MOLU|nr:ABC transporter permease [Spiroplasma alleghenense]AXK51408.1 putative ABC transporter [Spiroplasma alleghenense]